MSALISIAVLITVLCLSEIALKRMPKVDAWLDRFLGGNAPLDVYDASEFNERHPL